MPIQEIKNAITGEHGFQARYFGWSAYASIRTYGQETALKMVTDKLEQRMKEHPVQSKVVRGGKPLHNKPRLSPGFSGIYFRWRKHSAGNYYPCIEGHFKKPNSNKKMALSNFSYAILSNGIYGSATKASRIKNMYGFPCPDIQTLATAMLKWLKQTSKQHNFDIYDIPDITNEGKLMQVQTADAKKILVIGNNVPPTTMFLKDEEQACLINWAVIAKGGDANRVQSALKADNSTATKKQRQAAAEALALVAMANDADGYFVSVGNDLMPFVEKVFRQNELAIVGAALGAGNVPIMVYK